MIRKLALVNVELYAIRFRLHCYSLYRPKYCLIALTNCANVTHVSLNFGGYPQMYSHTVT